jgi:VWFA-related protein
MRLNNNSYWWVGVIFLVLIVPGSYGQAGTPPTPPTAEPDQAQGISVGVDEVSLDVAVHDKHRKPVLDLKPEDIEVTDNGIPVTLKDFRLVKGDVSSSRGHLITLVFDRFEGATAKNAQNVANKVVKVLPAQGYSFAVLDFAGRLRLLQGYTDDRHMVETAIGIVTASEVTRLESTRTNAVNIATDKADPLRAKASGDAEKNLIAIARTGLNSAGVRVGVEERAQCQALLAALEDAQKIRHDEHAMLNLAGLLALVRAQQHISERKSIIYFTRNMLLDNAAKEMLKTISGAATQAGVNIYTVDMDAVNFGKNYQEDNANLNGQTPFNPAPVAINPYQTATPMQQQGGYGIQGPLKDDGQGHMVPTWGQSQDVLLATDFMRGRGDPTALIDTKNPLSQLSNDTGGIYIDAQNSLKKPLQDMLEDMTTYYQMTYKPPIEQYDGAFRTIVAKPKRAGLNLKTKTGYFALSPGADAGIRPFEVPLLNLFNQSNLPQDVKFHAAVVQFGELPDGNTSTVAIEVPISALEANKDAHTNLYSAHVSIVAEIKDKSGTVVEHFGENITKRGAAETLRSDPTSSVILQGHFLAVPGKYMLEAAVHDETGLKYGAQRLVFEIPAVQASPSLSPIVLVKHVDTITNDNEDPLEPMRYEKGKITPNLAGVVPPGTKDVSLFFILHPDPRSKEPATLEMEASRNGHAGRRTPLPLTLNDAKETVPYLATFKGASLAPGNYEVKAMMSQGGKTAVQQIAFNVQGDGSVAGGGTSGGHGGSGGDLTVTSEANDSYSGGLLAITAVTDPVTPPSQDEIDKLIEDARVRAVGYMDALPNFMCVEITDRSVDVNGTGNWKHRDTIAELLRYRDKNETHTMLEINGVRNTADRDNLLKQKGSTLSGGELGGVLRAVFAPSAKAEFHWKETDALGSGTVQVFDYHVAKSNSMYSVVGSNDLQLMVAFHGQVFIDNATRNVRRISLEAEDLPKDFPTRSSVMGVDYDYVSINNRDYLMPVSAELRVRQSHHQASMNTIQFRDYKKYGSAMKIVDYKPVGDQKQ